MPGRGARRRGRHDRPAPHDPRSRPARDHGDPVRVRRRRRAGVRVRQRRQPLPVRARQRPRRRVPARRRAAGPGGLQHRCRRRSGRCARRCRRSWTTRAPGRGCGRCRSRRRGPRCRRSRTPGLAPFAPYHWLLYGESLWFDITQARTELGWEPRHSNASMVVESYEWFLAHRHELGESTGSEHQSAARLGVLKLVKRLP